MHKIEKMSRFLKMLSLAMLVVLPLYNLGYWLSNGYEFWFWKVTLYPQFEQMPELKELYLWQKVAGFCVVMIPMSILMIAFSLAASLFELYSSLEIFSMEAIRLLRKIALAIMILFLIQPFYSALISFVITIMNTPGNRMIGIAIGTNQMMLFAFGCLLYLIFWIMDEGRKLQDEMKEVI